MTIKRLDHVMFTVESVDNTVARLRATGGGELTFTVWLPDCKGASSIFCSTVCGDLRYEEVNCAKPISCQSAAIRLRVIAAAVRWASEARASNPSARASFLTTLDAEKLRVPRGPGYDG